MIRAVVDGNMAQRPTRRMEQDMSAEIRTFIIPDEHSEEARERLAHFLRSVEVTRIDTAYADGAWRILVLFQDMRLKEEAKQIESAIIAALNGWCERAALRDGVSAEMVLPEAAAPIMVS